MGRLKNLEKAKMQSENSHNDDANVTLVPAVYVNKAKQIHTVYYLIMKEGNR